MLHALAARERELVEFARDLIAIPSPNPPGDERELAERARGEMARLGFSAIRMVAMEPTRPNVVGEVVGKRTGQILTLNGHIDTKPTGDISQWATGPYDPVVRDGRLHGLGSADMKGAVAAMVYAGAALAEVGPPQGTLRVVLTADEENGSRFGARFLAGRPDFAADAVVVGEATGMQSPWAYIAVASRGIACFRVSVRGTQMHSSLSDQVPSVNASVKLSQVLARMDSEFRPRYPSNSRVPGGPTVNLGVTLSGGVFYGIYPGHAEFGIDVRTVPGMTHPELQADLAGFLEVLSREDPELDVAVEPVPELAWFQPSHIDPGHPLVAAAQSAARDVLGRDVPLGTMPAFTDGTHWHLAGSACIPAFGPGTLLVAHRPNEYVTVSEVVEAARIYALTAMRYLGAADHT
ncbi:MAG: M20 family metallopeptidase [Chloroflexi bacterium]|nr:MAG: M20 family metallopeptidase [Chloroflexota bacterium]TME58554.1 MAG: M20 family metallopeptidase [Chloroflexota bacterium]